MGSNFKKNCVILSLVIFQWLIIGPSWSTDLSPKKAEEAKAIEQPSTPIEEKKSTTQPPVNVKAPSTDTKSETQKSKELKPENKDKNGIQEEKPVLEPLIEGFYPAYPPTTPATGDKADLIKAGEYLAKLGDCIACHTNVKEKKPAYSGTLPINTPFGTFYSPNITPDKETGIGNWTEEDFKRAMKEGRDPHGANYFPVFPYPYFAKMTDSDLKALYTYFMNIPAIKQKNIAPPFPFNMPGARFSLWGWNLLFFYPGEGPISYDSNQSKKWNRGRYIVDGLGHCSMCHTPLNIFGSAKNKYYLTGAFVGGYWAPNITRYGLSTASHQEIAQVFSGELINKAGPVAGPMAEVNHNSLSHLSEEDKFAIATYLKSVVSTDPLNVPQAAEEQPPLKRGKQVYINSCILCHQDGKMSAPIIGNAYNWYSRLKTRGITSLYRHTIRGYNSMPVKGACVTCTDNDVIAAVDYILNESLTRSQWQDLKTAGTAKYKASGEEVYRENCSVCHNGSMQGAPKIGDKEAWAPLIAKGIDVLLENTMKADYHPKKGGCDSCTTGEILEAVKYIVSQSKTEGNYSLW